MNAQQIRDALLPTRAADNGTACASCMRPSPSLVGCSACRCVKYCDRSCQAADWKKCHRQVCKVVKSFKRAAKLGELTGYTPPDAPLVESKHYLAYKFTLFKQMAAGGPESRSSMGLPEAISEHSWTRAKNLVTRSACCAVCGMTDFSFDPNGSFKPKWKCCPRCDQGWCCSASHFQEYLPSHSPEICDIYRRAANIDLFKYNHAVNHGDTFLYVPDTPTVAVPLLADFPSDWHGYFMARAPVDYGIRRFRVPEEFFPASTKQLSQASEHLPLRASSCFGLPR